MKKTKSYWGVFWGTLFGLVAGLLVALGVAIYVTGVPVPYVSKGDERSQAERDAAEAVKNQNWNGNTKIQGGPVMPRQAQPNAGTQAAGASGTDAAAPGVVGRPLEPLPAVVDGHATPGAASADPLGDFARQHAAATSPGTQVASTVPSVAIPVDPFDYFVQAGSFRSSKEAEAQRARLAIMGWESRISEAEQAGRINYRVRVGPFSRRADAEQIKKNFDEAGEQSLLVRVQH